MNNDNTLAAVPETPETEETKKKFHLNRKVVGGVLAGITAAVAAVLVAKRVQENDSEASDEFEDPGTVETFDLSTDTSS